MPVPVDFGSLKSTSALDTGGAVDDADAEEGVKSPLSVLLDDEEALVRAWRGSCCFVQGSIHGYVCQRGDALLPPLSMLSFRRCH